MKKSNSDQEVYAIDLLRLIRVLWSHAIRIILIALIGGGIGFSLARFVMVPRYQAQVLMYVNNSTVKISGSKVSISSSEITAAQSLVDTYIVILNSRITLEEVIEKAGVNYSYEQLAGMVRAEAVNETEVFRVTVTSTSPAEAKLIANTISVVLPKTISNVVDGSDVRVVDYAVMPTHRSFPSYTKYAALGLILGGLLSAAFVVIRDLMDDIIHDTDFLHQNFEGIPVLSVIPDLSKESGGNSKYDYNYKYKAYGGDGGEQKEPAEKHDGEKGNKR